LGFPRFDAPRVACDPIRGHLYIAYSLVEGTPSGTIATYESTIQFVRSLDGGQTWSAPQALSSADCNGAQVATGPDGEVYVVWEEFGSREVVGRRSLDFGVSFGEPFVVATMHDNLSGTWIGWLSSSERKSPAYLYPALPTNFPSLAVDRSGGPRRGAVYVTWPEHSDGAVQPVTRFHHDTEPNDGLGQANPVELNTRITGSVRADPNGNLDSDVYTFEGTAGTMVWLDGYMAQTIPAQSEPRFRSIALYCAEGLTTVGSFTIMQPSFGTLPPLICTLPV